MLPRSLLRVAAGTLAVLLALIGGATTASADDSAPSTPTNVSTSVSGSTVSLVWAPSTDDVGVAEYEVHTSQTQEFFHIGASTLLDVTSEPSYDDTYVPQGTWYYRIVALDAAGNRSYPSDVASATVTVPSDVTPPSTPTGVTATASGDTVSLAWTASSDDASGIAGYAIHAATIRGACCQTASFLDFVTETSYQDVEVPAGTWYYQVVAYDGYGNTSPATEDSTVVVADVRAPSVPADVATAVSGQAVSVSWSAAQDDVAVTAYDVHRGMLGFVPSSSTLVATTSTLSTTNVAVPPGTWYYRVVARDAGGNVSTPSTAVAASVSYSLAAPTPVIAAPRDSSAVLAWLHRSSTVGATYEYVVTIQPGGRQLTTTQTRLTVTGLVNGTTYTFSVYARNSSGRSAEATSAPFTPLAPPAPPDVTPPYLSRITLTPGIRNVSLSWGIVIDDRVETVVRRVEGEVAPALADGVEVTRSRDFITGAASSGLVEGRTYTFSVWTYDPSLNYGQSSATLYGSVLSRSAARSVTYGASVTHRTKLSRVGTVAGIAAQKVRLYKRTAGSTTWTIACYDVATSSTGDASCVTKPTRNANYEWRFFGSGNQGSASSSRYVIVVRPAVTSKVSATTVWRGSRVTISGSVAPRHGGKPVYLQRYSSGAWRTVARSYLSSTSTYTFRTRPQATYSYRVYQPRNADHGWGASRTRRVFVR